MTGTTAQRRVPWIRLQPRPPRRTRRRPLGQRWSELTHALGRPVEFLPGPELTDRQAEIVTEPVGQASRPVQALYVATWVVQVLGVVAVPAVVTALVLQVVSDSQVHLNTCLAGQTCGSAGSVIGYVFALVLCVAVVVVMRPVRAAVRRLLQWSAARDAERLRAQFTDQVVVLDGLGATGRWLLRSAQRLLSNYPPRAAAAAAWDVARRLDAAAVLRRLAATPPARPTDQTASQLAADLAAAVEQELAQLRQSVLEARPFSHSPWLCTATSTRVLPRADDPATVLADARLLLPATSTQRRSLR